MKEDHLQRNAKSKLSPIVLKSCSDPASLVDTEAKMQKR